MSQQIHLCLVLHNHQPIGNFDGVFEQAYYDSYLPFLDIFEPFENLKISLHTSGPLMLWLHERKPEYLDRVARLVAGGRIEIIGGPFYESILTMLPSRDRVGQIRRYTEWLENRFDTRVQGMWVPERVWEGQLTADLARAGMGYTVLDDFHFRAAGWAQEDLQGYYVTEEDGELMRVFPGSEKLRYLIPFAPVQDTIRFAWETAQQYPGSILVLGDDGEKFGTWPDTKAHVYERGWLREFLSALNDNRHWLQTSTLAEAIEHVAPLGKCYLPDCSYREMTEWALPVAQQEIYDDVTHAMHDSPQWPRLQRFVRGGSWRNFKVKYAEANEMYSRMLEISKRLDLVRKNSNQLDLITAAEDHLHRGQCNCAYWHGAFGGIYLPHLRNAIFKELIQADSLLDQVSGKPQTWVEASTDDFNNDASPEVRLANDQMICYLAPSRGGMLYELDVRSVNHNLLATLQRRPESYHRKVLAGPSNSQGEVASIHDRVVFKQAGLDQRLQYDRYQRKSLQDHFLDDHVSVETLARGDAAQRGDFLSLPFDAKIRRGNNKIQVQMFRDGNAWGIPIRLTKAITLESGSTAITVAYLLEGLPAGRPLHFATEWNFAGMPAGADDRFFYDSLGQRLGQLGTQLNLRGQSHLGLIDGWQALDVQLSFNQPTDLWTFPIETVSQSEGGFELVHQSVCVMPHWMVTGDQDGRWSMQMQVSITSNRVPEPRIAEALVGSSV